MSGCTDRAVKLKSADTFSYFSAPCSGPHERECRNLAHDYFMRPGVCPLLWPRSGREGRGGWRERLTDWGTSGVRSGVERHKRHKRMKKQLLDIFFPLFVSYSDLFCVMPPQWVFFFLHLFRFCPTLSSFPLSSSPLFNFQRIRSLFCYLFSDFFPSPSIHHSAPCPS